MEVMGLMLGEFVDEYTVRVVDVFAMPQSGTGVSVEAVDHAFQTNMLDMLKQTGRSPSFTSSLFHLPLLFNKKRHTQRKNKKHVF
jgi:26S proteasome regulatory subunit N11